MQHVLWRLDNDFLSTGDQPGGAGEIPRRSILVSLVARQAVSLLREPRAILRE
jgi:hypothetical protein